ncbi:glucose 1-dehydrogenase [Rhodococcus sp. NM-2]|uniref:glucose 1-dehydrogenase n=1 Tax=Rhodococcus sp. NM-2 TaxID=3401174 RepID=UPI003AAE0894
MGRLSGQVAIVTGASRGMGAAHARAFAAEGAQVLLTDVLAAEGAALADELGSNARFAAHDVTRADDWDRVIALAEESFGPVSILVNNAGVGVYSPIEVMTEDEYRRVIDVNQVSTFLGMKAVAGSMGRAGRGSIINISSVAGFIGEAGTVAYAASKFAVRGMTKVAAKELGPQGIRVNSVHPGVIESPMALENDDPQALAAAKAYAAATPLGRMGRPQEVSNLVVFLASEESSFATGAAFVIDGGTIP